MIETSVQVKEQNERHFFTLMEVEFALGGVLSTINDKLRKMAVRKMIV